MCVCNDTSKAKTITHEFSCLPLCNFFAALSVKIANNTLFVFVAKLKMLHEIKVKEVMD